MTIYSSDTIYKNDNAKIIEEEKKVLSDGEQCTYKLAEKYNILKNNNFDTSIISKSDQNKINKYIKNDNKNYEYSLCNENNGEYYYNCALEKKNIWLTKDKNNKCKINEEIVLPPNKLEKIENKITSLKKPPPFTAIKNLSESDNENILCNERWYDWFTIPDYHNGNKYTKELDGDTYKCFKPCKFGSIISSNTEQSSIYIREYKNKCINRDLIDNGRLKNTLLFTPYAIIFLFGLTKNDLIDLYKYELGNIESIVNDNNKNPNKLYDYEINNNILNQIKQNDTTFENIINDLKKIMKTSIQQLITEPISHLNIIPPHDNLGKLNNEPLKYYNNEKYIKKAYEIATKLNKYLTDISLKSDFYLWKKQLQNINDFDINSWEFNKVLLLLQASCMLCFGYQNPKDILYKKQKEYNEFIIQKILKFNDNNITFGKINFPRIKNSQVLKSIDTNNPFNNMKNNTLDSINLSKIKQYQIQNIDDDSNDEIPNDMKQLNICDVKFYNYDNTIIKSKYDCTPTDIDLCVNKINIDMIDNCFTSYLINLLNSFFVIIVIVLFIFLSYLLIILVWSSFANVINYIILGFIWIFAVFIGTFQTFVFRTPNTKGIILEIHKLALKGEFWTDQYMKTLAMLNNEKDVVFYFMLSLAGIVIFSVILKSLYDLVLIFIADSRINTSSNKSGKTNNAMRYIFSC